MDVNMDKGQTDWWPYRRTTQMGQHLEVLQCNRHTVPIWRNIHMGNEWLHDLQIIVLFAINRERTMLPTMGFVLITA